MELELINGRTGTNGVARRLAEDRAGFPHPLGAVAFSTRSQVGVPPTWLLYSNDLSHALASREERVPDPSCSDDRATGVLLFCASRNVRFRSLAGMCGAQADVR
jgi:hypothetical protein